MRPLLAGALFALLSFHELTAQVRVVRTGDARLTGITELDVSRFQQTQAASCALNLAELQSRTVEALRAADIKTTISERAPSSFYSLVIDIHSASSETTCVAAVTTELIAEVEAQPEADKHALPGSWGSLYVVRCR